MRIATWNVNSIRQRAENLAAWLRERQPDIVCLQETKCVDEGFPRETFETNVPGVFLAGGAICGRDTSNIFIENGRFHGETIIKTIAERRAMRGAVTR